MSEAFMSEKLPEACGEVEIKMQEDFKNQLQNTLGLWKKKGQAAIDDLLNDARHEIQARLSQQGVAERWPALVNLIQEFSPELAPAVAGIIGRRSEPLANWLNASVVNWAPYKIELSVAPEEHLLEAQSWQAASLVGMAELAGRWLIEKHAPPGNLNMAVAKVELECLSKTATHCTVRCELDVAEFELAMARLLKEQQADVFLTVMIWAANNVLLSQANFHFELKWAPLLK